MQRFRSARFVTISLLLFGAIVFSPSLRAQSSDVLPIMPLPAHVVRGQGQFLVNGSFNLKLEGYTEPRLERARQRFLKTLSRETGIPVWRTAQFHPATFIVRTKGPSDPVQQLGEDESYHLQVTPTEVLLTAPNPLGVLHGLQTFLQLVRVTPQGFSAPAVTIDDQPRFPWRGLLIDVSRHFMQVSVLKRELDGMAAVKLNVLHLHLSDDQGFRVESKKFPLLTKDGSDGMYYTQAQIKDLIAYARDRGIRIVPEFDMPCHTASWMVGYPQLASAPGPHRIAQKFGGRQPLPDPTNAAMDPTKASTYKFIDEFIGEMAGLFPDAYFHVGGDECSGKEWDANPEIQKWMHAHHVANNAALQAYFTGRVEKIVAKHHKIMVGWDEVLQPDTPKNVLIQNWGDLASLASTVRRGYHAIYSGTYYLSGIGSTPAYYLADPFGEGPSTLTAQEKAGILGGEAAMWTECASPENVDSRIWPNLAAVAERFWSPQNVRDLDSMYRRLWIVSQELKYHGIDSQATTEVMLERMSGNPNPVSLRILASALRPSLHGRLAHDNVFTPLNRMVDAVPVVNMTTRTFKETTKRIASGTASEEDWRSARKQLTMWRDNHAKLQPLLGKSSLTQGLGPVSQNVSQTAAIGLDALDALKGGHAVSPQKRGQDLKFLKTAEKLQGPQGDLVNAVAPSVELLVQATKSQ